MPMNLFYLLDCTDTFFGCWKEYHMHDIEIDCSSLVLFSVPYVMLLFTMVCILFDKKWILFC